MLFDLISFQLLVELSRRFVITREKHLVCSYLLTIRSGVAVFALFVHSDLFLELVLSHPHLVHHLLVLLLTL